MTAAELLADRDWLALLAAVRATPADDLPRLVAADWLEERGQPGRAEFIRAQCESVRLRSWEVGKGGCGHQPGTYGAAFGRCGCRACDLDRRSMGLLESLAGEWFGPGWRAYPDSVGGQCRINHEDGRQYDLSRGFVAAVTCPAAAWVAHGDVVRKQHPVERVRLTDWPDPDLEDDGRRAYRVGWRLGGDPTAWLITFEDLERSVQAAPGKSQTQVVCEARWPGVAFEMPARR